MKLAVGAFCISLVLATALAADDEPEAMLPSYRPVAGVVGFLGCHSSAGAMKLMQIWRAEFERIYPGLKIKLDDDSYEDVAGGAGTFGPRLGQSGAPAVKRFTRRFAHAPVEIPVCWYVIEVLVHKDNAVHGGLSLEEVERIFAMDAPHLSWGHLGITGDRGKGRIPLYAPRERAEYLLWTRFGIWFMFKPAVLMRADSADVVTSVSGDICGLGLAECGAKTAGVRALPLSPAGESRFVPATPANVRNGSYPLVEALYLTLNHDPEAGFDLDPVRREFLRYILSREGQQAVDKAGHVALSAEQADRALAQLGVTPTGPGTWEHLLPRLRARRPPAPSMTRIERRVGSAGDQPTNERLAEIARLLASTKLTSSVTFETVEAGATIRLRFMGHPDPVPVNDWTHKVEATLPIGLYCVWTEREGKPTSPTDVWFPIIRERERIRIYETSVPEPRERHVPGAEHGSDLK